MPKDTELTPVLFRVDEGEVVAVFPCEQGTPERDSMTCYAHVGQHSSCSIGWYQKTRPATPAEYSALKAELEAPPYGYRLRVYRRLTRELDERRRATLDQWRTVRAA